MGSSLGFAAGCGGVMEGKLPEGTFGQLQQAGDTEDPYIKRQGPFLHGFSWDLDPVMLRAPLSSLNHPSLTEESRQLHLGDLRVTGNKPLEAGSPSLGACSGTPVDGVTRNCGWRSLGVGSCTPGSPVTVGTGSCSSTLCSGDPLLRVCEGLGTCEHASATLLGSNDNTPFCGKFATPSACPRVNFTCPSSGSYNVMLAPSVHGTTASMMPLVSSGVFPVKETRSGELMAGATLIGQRADGATMRLRIRGVLPMAPASEPERTLAPDAVRYRYDVVEVTGHGTELPLCADSMDVGGEVNYAIAVPGYWTYPDAHSLDYISDAAFVTNPQGRAISKPVRPGETAPWGSVVLGGGAAHGAHRRASA